MRMSQIGRQLMSLKVWDVVKPRNDWERNMAHIQYLLVGLRMTFSTRIRVQEKILGDYYDAEPWELA